MIFEPGSIAVWIWRDSGLFIPLALEEDGRAALPTLLIPFYESAAETAADWRRLQVVCQFIELEHTGYPDSDLCLSQIRDYESGRFTYVDEGLEIWAGRLAAAYQTSETLQSDVLKQDFMRQPIQAQDLTPATLPADFLANYEAAL